MINYDTIISNFDDKVTLYNWLRKVEEALKNASATNFVVNKKGNATLSFSITFADGETLESGDIVLQQGESVDQARIASGVLQLHLTNGTWLTAGNIKPVSNFSINADQHLIVNYQDSTSQDLGAIYNGNVNVDGNFTANSIIENMNGYAFNKGFTGIDIQFAGVVKNGNKLTFAIAGRFNGTQAIAAYGTGVLGTFTIPSEVGQKIYPILENRVSFQKLIAYTDIYTNREIIAFMGKDSSSSFTVQFATITEIPADYKGAFRYEETFLLSDNLAQ